MLGAYLLPDLALVFVGGDEYAEISEHLWIFATLGTVLAMLQLVIYSVVARQGQRSVYLVWTAFVTLLALGQVVHTLDGLVTVVLLVDLALFVVMLAVTLRVIGRPSDAVDVGTSPL